MPVRTLGVNVCFPVARTKPASSGDEWPALPRALGNAGMTGVVTGACRRAGWGTGILDGNVVPTGRGCWDETPLSCGGDC